VLKSVRNILMTSIQSQSTGLDIEWRQSSLRYFLDLDSSYSYDESTFQEELKLKVSSSQFLIYIGVETYIVNFTFTEIDRACSIC